MEKHEATYLPELMAEKDSIDPSFVHAVRLISSEIEKIKNPQKERQGNKLDKEEDFYNVHDSKYPKIECSIKVPTDLYPRINFVGRLIGPGGSTLKGIQEVTRTRIAILGKGSIRDKKRQEEIASGNEDKLAHLKLPLHVKITCVAPVDQAYMNVGRACSEISKLLHVDEEEAAMMNMETTTQRGGFPARGGSGRGGARGRGRGNLSSGGRGSGRGSRGTGRGSAGGRGQANSRMNTRGRGGTGGARAAKTQMLQQAQDPYAAQVDEYGYEYDGSYEAYGAEYAESAYDQGYGEAAYAEAYDDGSYGATESYDAYSYGDGYDAYGNGAAEASYGGATTKSFRGKMRGGTGRGRASKPY